MTVKNKYLLSLIFKLVSQLYRTKYFTKLDVCWGFNNVQIKLETSGISWLGKTAKSLFYFTFFFFSFLFFSYLDLLYKKEVQESVTWQCCMSQSHVRMSHDECGKVVHRPCSSCISSVQNQMGTLLSSPCQLGLGVWLSHLRLSCYMKGHLLYQPWSVWAPSDVLWDDQ